MFIYNNTKRIIASQHMYTLIINFVRVCTLRLYQPEEKKKKTRSLLLQFAVFRHVGKTILIIIITIISCRRVLRFVEPQLKLAKELVAWKNIKSQSHRAPGEATCPSVSARV